MLPFSLVKNMIIFFMLGTINASMNVQDYQGITMVTLFSRPEKVKADTLMHTKTTL